MTPQEFYRGTPCSKHLIPAPDCRDCTEIAAARRKSYLAEYTRLMLAQAHARAIGGPYGTIAATGHITDEDTTCSCDNCNRERRPTPPPGTCPGCGLELQPGERNRCTYCTELHELTNHPPAITPAAKRNPPIPTSVLVISLAWVILCIIGLILT